MKLAPNRPCPCGRGPALKRCCGPWLGGAAAPDPEALMRSRFVAYAAGKVAYILNTTDPSGPQAKADRGVWADEVRAFMKATRFEGLEVRGAGSDGDHGWVEFTAYLSQGDDDATFSELSQFRRVRGRWFYHSGAVR